MAGRRSTLRSLTPKSQVSLSVTCSSSGPHRRSSLSLSSSYKVMTAHTQRRPLMTRLRQLRGGYLNLSTARCQLCSLIRGKTTFSTRISVRKLLRNSKYRSGLTPRQSAVATLRAGRRLTSYLLKTRHRVLALSKTYNEHTYL